MNIFYNNDYSLSKNPRFLINELERIVDEYKVDCILTVNDTEKVYLKYENLKTFLINKHHNIKNISIEYYGVFIINSDFTGLFEKVKSFKPLEEDSILFFNGDISNIFRNCTMLVSIGDKYDTSHVTNMNSMFYNATLFNQPLKFDTSNVTDMSLMFYNTISFNQTLNFNDTSNVTDMSFMFCKALSFNQTLNLNTICVKDMSCMFYNATLFNQPLNLNTSSVTRMGCMFYNARSFNQPLNFDTSSVTRMTCMFYNTTSFNQLLNFNIMQLKDSQSMFHNSNFEKLIKQIEYS